MSKQPIEPLDPLAEAVASAMRAAYGKTQPGGPSKAWERADNAVKASWRVCAKTAIRVIEQEREKAAK